MPWVQCDMSTVVIRLLGTEGRLLFGDFPDPTKVGSDAILGTNPFSRRVD